MLLSYHRIGRQIYALGGNSEAARAAGVRVDRLTFQLFVVASLLAALAGVIIMGRIGSLASSQGKNLIFAVMAASVLGGVSMNGGRGRLTGALLGVLFLGTVSNILLLAGAPTFWLDATNGALILVALLVARLAGSRKWA
jgi:simple sugar transport system permease protein